MSLRALCRLLSKMALTALSYGESVKRFGYVAFSIVGITCVIDRCVNMCVAACRMPPTRRL